MGGDLVNMERRKALKKGGGLGLLGVLAVLGLIPGSAWAGAGRAALEAGNLSDAFDALGVTLPENSELVRLTVPDVAENGAVVPVTVESSLAHIEQISILVDKNINVLAANFIIPRGVAGFITTRIKIGQTATVVALVRADGKFYRASKEVQVTQGGCSA